FDLPAPVRTEASIFDLVNAVNTVLKRFSQREDLRDIFEDKWTVSEKIQHLLRLIQEQARLRFSELFAGVTSRSEVVATFLALLELIRLKQLAAIQPEPFGEIEICRPEPAAPVAESATVSATTFETATPAQGESGARSA